MTVLTTLKLFKKFLEKNLFFNGIFYEFFIYIQNHRNILKWTN